jgi:CO/xanthine dehydrogenase FAD-binding subunit
MAVGQMVDPSFLNEKFTIQLNKRGLIKVSDETQMTSQNGILAGGDATTGPATVVNAVANGRKAVKGMNKFLNIENGITVKEEEFTTFNKETIKLHNAVILTGKPPAERTISEEDTLGLSQKEMGSEAGRCMNCACYSVNASDIAPVLMVLDARIKTTKREFTADDFCGKKYSNIDNLESDELVTEIVIPFTRGKMDYDKFRVCDAIDFAIVSLASVIDAEDGVVKNARFVFGGIAPIPVRASEVEEFVKNKKLTEAVISKVSEIAVTNVSCMEENTYKVQEMRALISRALLAVM